MKNTERQRKHRATNRDKDVVNLNVEVPRALRIKLQAKAKEGGVTLKKLLQDSIREIVND